jgi:hypothetical protein
MSIYFVFVGLNHGRTSSFGSEAGTELELGDRVVVAGQRKGIIKYIGDAKFSPGKICLIRIPTCKYLLLTTANPSFCDYNNL